LAIIGAGVVVFGIVAAPSPADARTGGESDVGEKLASPVSPTVDTTRVVSSTIETSDECLTAVEAARAGGQIDLTTDVCTATITLKASAPRSVSLQDIAKVKGRMSATDYQTLTAATMAGTVRSKSYSQSKNNITDGESQFGTFYYDGARVWVTQSYRGIRGTHHCKVDWAVGYVVDLKECSESGSLSQRNLWAKWHFSVIPSGGLANWDEYYFLHVNSAGRIW
jgi:hypothetical protein